MATISKKKIPIKKSDLKKAILSKNNTLKKANEALESSIKVLKKEEKVLSKSIKSSQADQENVFMELESVKKELGAVKNVLETNVIKVAEASVAESELISASVVLKEMNDSYEKNIKKQTAKLESLKSEAKTCKDLIKVSKSLKKDVDSYKEEIAKLKASKVYYK